MQVITGQEEDSGYTISTPAGTSRGLSRAGWVAEVRRLEEAEAPRWVLPSVDALYPKLIDAGVRLGRCYDLGLAEGLLLAYEGRESESRSLRAAWARAQGEEPPDDGPAFGEAAQPTLFSPRGPGLPSGVTVADAVRRVLVEQEKRVASVASPGRMRVLLAAESASALAAAEMSAAGLPWRADLHRALLESRLGPRVPSGQRPKALVALAAQITDAFGGRPVNPDSSPSVIRALAREGIEVPAARKYLLRDIDHPAVAPLLEYKELSRLHSANGWAWLDEWVTDGRFRPHYVVGGVVSGRWATRGGGALQIPKVLRTCVRADPGWKLVVADAAQLEPRVLTALSGDRRLAEVSAATDLYARLGEALFSGARYVPPPSGSSDDRSRAKIAMLSAMYGGTSGEAGPLLALLRQRFPDAVSYVEQAAAAGERGERVRSRLGRTSPAPSAAWRALTGGLADDEATETRARRASRGWGRFTRNFVVQASAADLTAVLLATLRGRLPAPAHLVFFQHDEVIVHTPAELAPAVSALIESTVTESAQMLFGEACPVHFPMQAAAVDTYADAK
ncbi:bifunctional 3'-5' exonuclease/DNA polymerase [Amycolatopsis sp. DSM 110486]|uniref:bifunctional 3'-5' exonuclease/DNA polymerase n=1 Tax=Amycolatopsis sp. DSM 110486 TaxID=2865832 RepID=UPI001C6A5D4F|nr:bifunctional 3'-5' exonuclease/DNA polymerase [Amycolatopsis sp. DSM 110486]QYN21860.1 bifunctional 3'-5' exonuclease/DNA polymerase [Amycolatopsis sp. DSM 110486]